MRLKSKFSKAIFRPEFFLVVIEFISAAGNFAVLLLLGALVGTEELGIYSMFLSLYSTVFYVFNCGAWRIALKLSYDNGKLSSTMPTVYRQILTLNMMGCVASSVVFLIIGGFLYKYFDISSEYRFAFFACGLVVFLMNLDAPMAYFRVTKNYFFLGFVRGGMPIFRIASILLCWIISVDPFLYVIFVLLADAAFYFFVSVFYFLKVDGKFIGFSVVSSSLIKEVKGLYLANFIDLPVIHSDRLLVFSLLGASDTAVYTVLRRLSQLVARIGGPIYQLQVGSYAKMLSAGSVSMLQNVQKQAFILALVGCLACIVIFIGCFYIPYESYSFEFRVLDLGVFLVVSIVTLFMIPYHSYFFAKYTMIQNFKVLIASNVAFLFLLYFLVPIYGVLGAGLALVFQAFFAGYIKILFIRFFD